MLTTVATFREPWEAHMFRGRLEAEGIPAMIIYEHHIGACWPLSTALGGVKVQVPRQLESDAHTIELRCRNGLFAAELQAELGDLDDIRCPVCGATHFSKRRPLPQLFVCVILTLFFGAAAPPWSWIRYCESCGTKFKL